MKFSGREDIEAPVEAVFEMVSEFESFERSAIRRGIEVQRVDETAPKGVGMAWDSRFTLRGSQRELHLVLKQYEPPSLMRFESFSKGVNGVATVELLALSPRRTRLGFDLELKANSLAARLVLQSMKLARRNLERRFKLRMAEFAKDLEDRYAH